MIYTSIALMGIILIFLFVCWDFSRLGDLFTSKGTFIVIRVLFVVNILWILLWNLISDIVIIPSDKI